MHYNKEGLREELRQALLVVPRTRGQLEGFENNGYDSKYAKTPMREEINGVKVQAQVVTVLACKTFKKSPMPLPSQAFAFTRLVRAMNEAGECEAQWLRYCYSDGAQLPSVDFLLALLAQFRQEEPRTLRGKSAELIKHLALLACQQKRDEINAGKDRLPQTQIAQLAGMTKSAWDKNWSCRWKRLLRIIETFDQEGLNRVYEYGRRAKAARRHRNVPVQCCLKAGTGSEVVARVAV